MGAAADGARREADRERRTVRVHWPKAIFFSQAIPGNSGQFLASKQFLVGRRGSPGGGFWLYDPFATTVNRMAVKAVIRESRDS